MQKFKAGQFLKHSSVLFSLFWCFTLLLSVIEIFNDKTSFVNINYFVIITLWLGLLSYRQTRKINCLEKYLVLLNKPLLILSTLSLIIFPLVKITVGSNNFPVYLNRLMWPFLLCLYMYFRKYFYEFYLFFNFKENGKRIFPLFLFSFFIFLFVNNVVSLSRNKINGIIFMLRHPFVSYDDKLKVSVGNLFYTYVLFIKENTPPDSKILIPPQGYPWPQTGNKGYLQYFLYPRYLFNGEEKRPGIDLVKEDIDYVLLTWGESNESEYGFTNGWPKFDVKAKKIIYLSNDNQNSVFNGNYRYDPEIKDQWGIIKIK